MGSGQHLCALGVCSCEAAQQLPCAGVQVAAIVQPLGSGVVLSPIHLKVPDPRRVQLILKQREEKIHPKHKVLTQAGILKQQVNSCSGAGKLLSLDCCSS